MPAIYQKSLVWLILTFSTKIYLYSPLSLTHTVAGGSGNSVDVSPVMDVQPRNKLLLVYQSHGVSILFTSEGWSGGPRYSQHHTHHAPSRVDS
jgi:hypothetical protein